MPFDYSSTAQALVLPSSPSPEPPSTPPRRASRTDADRLPPWAHPGLGRGPDIGSDDDDDDLFRRGPRPQGMRRLSTPYSRGGDDEHRPLGQRIMQGSVTILNKLIRLNGSMTPAQRVLAGAAGVVLLALGVLFLVFSHRIFAALRPVAAGWRGLPGGWVLLFLLCAAAAFPPLVGYSMTITLAGFVFGFPAGWPIVAGATVAGSTASFLASRTVLSGYVERLVGGDRRFVALGQVLRRDGLPVLVAIRFCPLPFSLSNGFLATIPSISPARFALATALSTPKLLVHVFIGDRLAQLADSDGMPAGARAVNYLSILFGAVVGVGVGWLVYRRTMRRAKELALEEAAATDGGSVLLADGFGYEDVEEGILSPGRARSSGEADAAALMDDDDISLWDTTEDVHDAYRDEDDADVNPGRGDGGATPRHDGAK
ncbi:hypothetical protein F4802DRAFT_501228 [Xylaria palmicola]|nr:hypothetical protein F4802DRAFT_501228 [Xylaria palmicola]